MISRMFEGWVRVSPTGLYSCSWSTRSSLAWVAGEMLPISSRNSVPPSATLNSPCLFVTAPVKAPLMWPNSSLSSSVSLSEPQSTGTNGLSLRRLL